MDVHTAALMFDNQQVYDAYTGIALFKGQPDLYDSTERDSETGYRRTISTLNPTLPDRGVIQMEDEIFLVGRTIKDYFQGSVIREHLLLHPVDGLIRIGPSESFLVAGESGDPEPTELYGGLSWVRDRKEELTTSRSYPVYHVFCHVSETLQPGWIVKDTRDIYHRIEAISFRTGGMQTALVYELGGSAIRTVSYTAPGTVYVPETGSSVALPPIYLPAVVETFRSNYHYLTNAAEDFKRADLIYTVTKAFVTLPTIGAIIADSGRQYRVLSYREDGGSWFLHARPI